MLVRLLTLFLVVLVTLEPVVAAAPDVDAVEQWADEFFADALARKRMAGAVLTVVQDGQIALSKGFGFADFTNKTPVDPDNTRFRIGSNTKTFTALAIAQLLEDGRISSLDDPANQYLKRLQLPTVNGIDITLSHLLTHSAGFENRVFNIATDRDVSLPLSEAEIERFEAGIVNAPGKYSSYNNYGTTVLGLLIEDVTSMTISDYFNERIFAPLNMSKSKLSMSPTDAEGLAVPHAFLPDGSASLIKNRSIQQFFAPVGAINATGNDMGRYMIAQLDQGTSDDAILGQEMFLRMHSQIRSNHSLSSGFGMIYFTWNWNGESIALHGGDWPGTHSGMLLMPNSNTGVFFSLLAEFPEIPPLESLFGSDRLQPNADVVVDTPISNLGVIYAFLQEFYGNYKKPQTGEFTRSNLSDYVGTYVGQSAPATTMERLLNLSNPFLVVNVTMSDDNGALMFNGAGPYSEIGRGIFWSDSISSPVDGSFLDSPIFNFGYDDDGNVEYLTPQIGFDAWVKSGWRQNPQTYSLAWAILFVVSLSSIVTIFYPRIEAAPLAKWLPSLTLLLLIAMPLVLLCANSAGETAIDDLFLGRTARFTIFAIIANLIAILATFFAWHILSAWREPYWEGNKRAIFMRVHYSILGLAAVLFIPIFYYLNLLGP